jgi:hypothetical protein
MKVRDITLATALSMVLSSAVFAQTTSTSTTGSSSPGANDFFGSSVGGGSSSDNAAGTVTSNAGPTDYTADEKRMQKKYKANVRSAQALIAKGERMMKSKEEKLAKKGKIFKEIGEKRLAELKANSPFPELADRPGKRL